MHRYFALRFFVLVSALILSACAGVKAANADPTPTPSGSLGPRLCHPIRR